MSTARWLRPLDLPSSCRERRPSLVMELLEERRLMSVAPATAASAQAVPVLVVGAAGGGAPRVQVLDAATGQQRFSFLAYDAGFTGGVRVATGDINGDGVDDIITAPGAGMGSLVRVFNGVDGGELRSFYAYGAAFTGGVNVAAGDVNGDGRDDILTGAGAGGGPQVRVFSGTNNARLMNFFAYSPDFYGGVNVAAGDVNGDGRADVVTGPGRGGGPQVRVFSGANGARLMNFFAYASGFYGGAYVAAGDLNGDGRAEIVTGAGPGGGANVQVFNGTISANITGFFAFDSYYRGLPVAVFNSQIYCGGSPNDVPLARAYSPTGTLVRDFSGLGQDFSQGMFVAAGTSRLYQSAEDAFEDNDALAQSSDLGTISSARTVSNLHLLDTADWFRFRTTGTGSSSSLVRIQFNHAQGDVDLALYNSSGALVRRSDGVTGTEQVSLDGLAAGDYFIKVYGYQGVHNPDYTLTVDATTIGSTPPTGSGNVLYVNFDGAQISFADLNRWSGGQWNPANLTGSSNAGVRIDPFFAGRSDREQIISGILSRLEADLSPFGISVRRHTGLAVENAGATTIFAGNSTLPHPHVACDVDFGNNNRTDIAFVGEEYWGSVANTVLAMSDVFLHEAGHTYGLYHTQVVQNGVLYNESMGLRYSTSQSNWLRDTSFMDRTFVEFRDENGNWHGAGGGQLQNSYQTLRRNLGLSSPVASGSLVTFDASRVGSVSITASAAADLITIAQVDSGVIELTINQQSYILLGEIDQLVIDTAGDAGDQVNVLGSFDMDLIVTGDSSTLAGKLDAGQASLWNGTALDQPGPGLGCGCPVCMGALDGALGGGDEGMLMFAAADVAKPASGGMLGGNASPGNETSVVRVRVDDAVVRDNLQPTQWLSDTEDLPIAPTENTPSDHVFRTADDIDAYLEYVDDLLAVLG